MKIAIEAQRIFRPNKHGMDFVALEAIRQLQKIDRENEYFIFVAPGPDRCLEESDNLRIVEVKCPTYPLWEQVALPAALRKVKPDLLHCTSNTAPIRCSVPLILTLHDIIFLEKRQDTNKSTYQNLGRVYRRFVVPRILPKCEKIITVSQFECDRIQKALGLPAGRIVAVHNGFGRHFHPVENYRDTVRKYLPDERYLFFLGNTDPKKNTPGTLKAYALYASQTTAPAPLLVADLRGEVVDGILREQSIEFIRPLLRLAGYIPNTDLPAIYTGAEAFLYTSFRESFGIPLLESMACGTPVITSDASAIPEIAGPGAILVDPYDPAQIAGKIRKLECDPQYRRDQVAYGLERVKAFSWEQTARGLLKIYKEWEVSAGAAK